MKNNNVTEKDLFYILDLFEHMKVTYWLDGGWGVDVLTGKQQREHRDIDIDFDAQHTQKVIQKLEDIGYKIEVDWMPSRMELKHKEYGYLDIHPINLNDDGSITEIFTDMDGNTTTKITVTAEDGTVTETIQQ